MEVHINDILVNSDKSSWHIADLEEGFDILRKHRMKFNPSKCAFGITFDKFLRFMVSQ